jgi:glycosyltransferase involved in cell wall biosynthesis
MGGEIPRKRLRWAIQILEGLADPRLTLVACGVPQEFRQKILDEFKPELRKRICFCPFVAEHDMPRLYQNAVALLYPTTYEGFGFPALEAQAVGTPALFSDVNGVSELKGPGAVVLPKDDLATWIAACRELVGARGDPATPDTAARKWAKGFSWEVCAAKTLDVYRLAANTRRQTVAPVA